MREGFAYGVDGAIANFVPDIREAARTCKGAFVLEIGTGRGDGSTIAIQEGLDGRDGALHVSVDVNDRLDLYRPDAPWWHLVLGNSRYPSTLADVVAIAGDRKPGLIYIDTEHTYDHMREELPLWDQIADDGTMWLFHDTYMFSCYNLMTDAIREFAAANNWAYDDFRTEPHGLGRMRRCAA